MRIDFVAPWPPLRGGIAQHSVALARAMTARGHAVGVIGYRRLYPRVLFPGRSEIDPAAAPPPGIGHRALLDAARPWTWRRAAQAVTSEGPDVVLVQRWHPYFSPALAVVTRSARVHGAAITWIFHNLHPHEGRALPWGPLLDLGVQAGDLCLTHSRFVAEGLRARRHGARVVQVPMPAHPMPENVLERSLARERLGLPPAARLFLVFGHVRAYKGLDVLLEAVSSLPVHGPAWQLLVVGEWYDYEGARHLRERCAALGGRVVVVDRYVAANEIPAWFAAADVVVAPHRSGTQSGCVPLAFAHGRPVIVADAGGVAEGVREEETGFVVRAGDAASLAHALSRVLAGHEFDEKAITTASRNLSWAPLLDELESFVADVRGRSLGRPAAFGAAP